MGAGLEGVEVVRDPSYMQEVLEKPAEDPAGAAVLGQLRGLGGHHAVPGPQTATHPARAEIRAPLKGPQEHP